MANIFTTPVDTFAMASGLYNAFAQGQKNADELAGSQVKRAETQQKMAATQQRMEQADWAYQIKRVQDIQRQLHTQSFPQSYAAGLVQAVAGYPTNQRQTMPFDYRRKALF